jgi:hypothetical protein
MSKELWEHQRETQIMAKMDAVTFMEIPEETREQMDVKEIDFPEWRKVYEQDYKWKELHKDFVEKLKARKEREAQIRAENK